MTRTSQHAWLTIVIWLGLSVGAAAQQAGSDQKPVADIGVSLGKLLPPVYGDYQTQDLKERTIDVRASIPMSPRFSLEAAVMIGRRNSPFLTRTEGLYFIQARQRLRSLERGRLRPFLVYGVAGYYAHVAVAAQSIRQPDGSVIDRPATSFNESDPPLFTTFGGGVEYRVAPRLALRADAQLTTLLYLPLGLRVSGGVTVPLGSYGR